MTVTDRPTPRVLGQARPADIARKPRVLGDGPIAASQPEPIPVPTPSTMPAPRTLMMPRRIGESAVPERVAQAAPAPATGFPAPRKMASSPAPLTADAPQPATARVMNFVSSPVTAPSLPPVPRPMRGHIRVGLRVSEANVQAKFVLQPEKIVAQVVRVLGTIVLDDLDWTQAQTVGVDLQREYGTLVQKLLDASSADVTRTAPQHLSRLLTVLQACAEDFNPTSLVGGWLRKDKPRAVDLYRKEIEQLRGKLNVSMADLDMPVRQIMDVRGKLNHLSDTLMAASLACEWLADTQVLSDEVRSVLIDRTVSLTKTAGLVQQQQAQSLATASQLDALRDRIQDAVLIALPTWLATLAGQTDTLNETQRFVVRDDLRQIIQRLKT